MDKPALCNARPEKVFRGSFDAAAFVIELVLLKQRGHFPPDVQEEHRQTEHCHEDQQEQPLDTAQFSEQKIGSQSIHQGSRGKVRRQIGQRVRGA